MKLPIPSHFEKILEELNRHNVKYLIVGGIAVNLHGFYRSTLDLDIILLLSDSNLGKFVKVIRKLGLVPRAPVKIEDFANAALRKIWIKNKNMKAFTLYDPDFQRKYLDVVIDHPLDFQQAFKRKKVFKDRGLSVPVIAVSDLLRMKKSADRMRDVIDIMGLKEAQRIKRETKKS